MKILLTGKRGQVGFELERSLQGLGDILALDSVQMDLRDPGRIREVVRSERPALIVNAAAYTAVDRAEEEPELAMQINAKAPDVLAQEARKIGAAMIHYSTDYVFDGTKTGAYTEEDAACPVNAYGRSKLAGEEAVRHAGIPYLILRTSWVYGMRGKNFLATILRLSNEKPELRIVSDQIGAPTWCRTVADTTALIVGRLATVGKRGIDIEQEVFERQSGVYHLAAQGQTSWHGFAQTILAHPFIDKKPVLTAIAASEYPSAARRPANSVLSCDKLAGTFCKLPKWDKALHLCLG